MGTQHRGHLLVVAKICSRHAAHPHRCPHSTTRWLAGLSMQTTQSKDRWAPTPLTAEAGAAAEGGLVTVGATGGVGMSAKAAGDAVGAGVVAAVAAAAHAVVKCPQYSSAKTDMPHPGWRPARHTRRMCEHTAGGERGSRSMAAEQDAFSKVPSSSRGSDRPGARDTAASSSSADAPPYTSKRVAQAHSKRTQTSDTSASGIETSTHPNPSGPWKTGSEENLVLARPSKQCSATASGGLP
jgi:hypothetical protein